MKPFRFQRVTRGRHRENSTMFNPFLSFRFLREDSYGVCSLMWPATIETKESFCIKKEFNSQRIYILLQYGRLYVVFSSNMADVTSWEHTHDHIVNIHSFSFWMAEWGQHSLIRTSGFVSLTFQFPEDLFYWFPFLWRRRNGILFLNPLSHGFFPLHRAFF